VQNQGACGFIQWAESEDCQVKTEMNGNVVHEITEHESPVNTSLSSESLVIRDPEISPDFSAAIVNSKEDGVSNGELSKQEVESWNPMQKALRVPDLLPQSYIRCPCGRGISNVRISKTQKNPGSKFYSCPEGKPPVGLVYFCLHFSS